MACESAGHRNWRKFREAHQHKKGGFKRGHTIPPSVLKPDNDWAMIAYCTDLRHAGPKEGEWRKTVLHFVFVR